MKLTPQTWRAASGNRIVTIGIAISATQPQSVRCADTSHTPSQSRLTFALTLELLLR